MSGSFLRCVIKFLLLFIDPNITIEVTTGNTPVIYQPLTLQCNAVIVGAITSRVDFIWTTGDTQIRRVNNVAARSIMIFPYVYNDSFIIPSFNISDIGRIYHCEVLINSSLPTAASSSVTIPVPGTELCLIALTILYSTNQCFESYYPLPTVSIQLMAF